jgi:hypothetical protein
LAFVGTYRGQFQFLGRLQQTPTLLKAHQDASVWAAQNPNGVVIDEVGHARDCTVPPSLLCRPDCGHYLVVREATQLVPLDAASPLP